MRSLRQPIGNDWKKLSNDEHKALVFQELKRRTKLINDCIADPRFLKMEMEMCKRDCKHFINNWLWTFNPREKQRKHFPFKMYPFQEEYIDWLEEIYQANESGLLEKSRDVGATWLNAAHSLHKWLFEPGFSALFGSIKEQKIDNNKMSSIFGKLRYMIYRLPPFFKPAIERNSINDGKLSLINPSNGNELIGEVCNDSFGRSGRASIVHIDEAAHIQRSEQVTASISETSDCIIYTSTPRGKGNEFARLRWESQIKVFILDWKMHPLKDLDWYNKKKETMDDWQIAQELDRSYERSKRGRIYKAFDSMYHVSDEIIECNPQFRQFITWDFGYAGAMAMLFIQIAPNGDIEIWNFFEISQQDIDFCMPIAEGKKPEGLIFLEPKEIKFIEERLEKIEDGHQAEHCGDNAGKQSTAASKRSCKDAIVKKFGSFKSTGKQFYDWRYKCLNALFKKKRTRPDGKRVGKIQVSKELQRVIDCLFNYEWLTKNVEGDDLKPNINEFSHIATALEFFAINYYPLQDISGVKEVQIR